MAKVWPIQVGDVYKKAILIKLADYSDPKGFCWPSLSTLSQCTEMSRATVCLKLKELEQDGWIKRVRRPFISTGYHLNLKKIGLEEEADPGVVVRQPDYPSPSHGPPSPRAGLPLVREPDTNHQLIPQRTVKEPSAKKERKKESWEIGIDELAASYSSALNSSPSTPQKQVPKGG